jgi:hypothetical protein
VSAPYFDANPCGYRISQDDLILAITTRKVKKAQVHTRILPTCSCQSVQSDSIIRINIMSTVKISLVYGIMLCGLVVANRRFRFVYSDNKGRKFV